MRFRFKLRRGATSGWVPDAVLAHGTSLESLGSSLWWPLFDATCIELLTSDAREHLHGLERQPDTRSLIALPDNGRSGAVVSNIVHLKGR